MDNLGGFVPGLVVAYTVTWIMVYFIVFQGVGSSGKVVYVTALLPYVALVAFFIRAITLPNAMTGLKFFLIPDFNMLLNAEVWQRAVIQIFYSLGVGFGSLIAFASYGAKKDDFVGNAVKVSAINCSTSMFAGVVVFPILGYLAYEMRTVNPCIGGDNLADCNPSVYLELVWHSSLFPLPFPECHCHFSGRSSSLQCSCAWASILSLP
jgi:SNF family Na+-dependent transporter